MEMIERYIYAVTTKLPQSQREEIGRELQGLIHDMLEARGESKTDEDIREVLLELGSPKEMADKYRGSRGFLISPSLFQSYATILKLVLISLTIGLSIAFVIETIMNPVSIMGHFAELIGSIVQVGLQTFAWITIVFALIDYKQLIPEGVKQGITIKWKPENLPVVPDKKKQIKRGEVLFGIIFSILIWIAFMSFTRYLGILVFEHDELKGVALFLNSDFLQYFLPAIYIMVGLSILKESLKLVVGRWTGKLAVSILVINTAILLLGLFLLRDGAIWNPSFVEELLSLREWGSLDSHAGEIHRMWESAKEWVRIGFVLTIFIETASVMYKGFKK
ncbi:hypothetical protein FGG79_05460 [Bacillus sp. BHET2]|uniref:HAAS signaling domain-containing protein n=1 Tax=Bacillus sp. BHET2 TaxID=2583818 RepID=UPI00110F3BD2|nr:hypothetical protein [Bacillus sp. BHET2]TMU87569.1 hypothetical protein FGG79_05460 [Bacillus sp. BHET2]